MTGPVLLSSAMLMSICVIRRVSPVSVMLSCALHMRAAWLWIGVARRAVADVLPRYQECVAEAKRAT